MEKNQTLQVTDLQKKKQHALEQLRDLLDYQDVKFYKEWLIRLSCFIMSGADKDSNMSMLGGDLIVSAENIWIFWRFFDFMEADEIDAAFLKVACMDRSE